MKPATQEQLFNYALLLEWHCQRFGCAPNPGGHALSFRSCPSCFGIQIDRDDVKEAAKHAFPESELGHKPNCELAAMIEALRPCKHEWRYDIRDDATICMKCSERYSAVERLVR